MALRVQVAHDFVCPWCWVGLFQAKRMASEFGAEIGWLGYELYPEGLDWPAPAQKAESQTPSKPKTPSRLDLMLSAEGLTIPKIDRPQRMRTHNAHQALEHAKTLGLADSMAERLYGAYWLEGLEINQPAVILKLAKGLIQDLDALRQAIEARRYQAQIVGFDEPAYASGVYNVPTFWIGGERYAEQPYSVLREAILRLNPEVTVYPALVFPPGPTDRPYTVINMVGTIDGKTVSSTREEPVGDLGSAIDHAAMRQIQGAVQAVMIGAGSLRATAGIWYPAHLTRAVVSGSGKLGKDSRFFTDAPEKAWVFTTEQGAPNLPTGLNTVVLGTDKVDLRRALEHLKKELGVQTLLVEGGSELNAGLLYEDLVDELFLTLAPKVKLGRETPTYAGGLPLPKGCLHKYELLEQRQLGDELFLRYRRQRGL